MGREAELGRLRELVARVRAGQGSALVVAGPPGIGKSCLLDAAADQAGGMQVVRVAGVQAERDVPYSTLHAVLNPLVTGRSLASLPGSHRVALETVLGRRDGAAPGRLAVGAATLSLIATVPGLLLLVDDVQWTDAASADALTFAARRLVAEPAGVLFGLRGDAPPDAGSTLAGLPCLMLSGLADPLALLPGVHPHVATWLHAASGGNPLAMLEAAADLTPAQETGAVPLPRELPETRPERLYAERLAAMPREAREAARILALAGRAPREVWLRAFASVGLDLAELAPLEQQGLCSVQDPVRWRHPLVRAAAGRGPTAETTAVHTALAAAWSERFPENPARAWHLADGTAGSAEAAADAADAWERAAQLTEEADHRSELYARAGRAAMTAGFTQRARDLVSESLSHGPESAQLLLTLGRLEFMLGRPDVAHDLMLRAADQASSPATAVRALAETMTPQRLTDDPARRHATVQRLLAIANRNDPVQVFLTFWATAACNLAAEDLGTTRAAADQAWALLQREGLLDLHPELVVFALPLDIYSFRPSPIRPVEQRALDRLRLSSDLTWLPQALRSTARRTQDTGDWTAARAAAEECELLARHAGQPVVLSVALLLLGYMDAIRGDAACALARANEADQLVERYSITSSTGSPAWTRGMVARGQGDCAGAVQHFTESLEKGGACLSDLVDALLALGTIDDARTYVSRLGQLRDSPWTRLGWAMLESNPERAAERIASEDSIKLDPWQSGFKALIIGERLRRAGNRRAARQQLQSALNKFLSVDAVPWIERAESELRASGAKLRSPADSGDRLTPSERRVAAMVAEGRSNKEVAALLFLSPKTVEFHLSRAFRKLGVNNRTALARSLRVEDAT